MAITTADIAMVMGILFVSGMIALAFDHVFEKRSFYRNRKRRRSV